jgi:FkbM family methyltransferase
VFFVYGALGICIFTQGATVRILSIIAWGIFLSTLIHIIMARCNTVTRWLANIFFVIAIVVVTAVGVFITLALKTNTLAYCTKAKAALINKVIYEDAEFQNNIIPTTHLLYTQCKLLLNIIMQMQQEKPLKLTNILNYQVLYQKPRKLHNRFSEIFIHNTYYFQTQTQEPFIIDGGSNMGLSIFYFKKLYPNAKIIGFEPEKTTSQILTQNINANNFHNITLVDKALSDKEETIQFHAKPSSLSTSSSIFKQDEKETTYPVQCVKLSSYISQPVDLLKLSVAGAETKVIQELAQAQKLSLIKEIIIKYYHHLDDGKDYLSLTLKALEDNGFGYMLKSSAIFQPLKKGSKQKIMIYAYKK